MCLFTVQARLGTPLGRDHSILMRVLEILMLILILEIKNVDSINDRNVLINDLLVNTLKYRGRVVANGPCKKFNLFLNMRFVLI